MELGGLERRRAGATEVPALARHRLELVRAVKELGPEDERALLRELEPLIAEGLGSGELAAWVCLDDRNRRRLGLPRLPPRPRAAARGRPRPRRGPPPGHVHGSRLSAPRPRLRPPGPRDSRGPRSRRLRHQAPEHRAGEADLRGRGLPRPGPRHAPRALNRPSIRRPLH